MFLCGHKTPELMRTPQWLKHPNGAKAFAGITEVAADPGATAAAMEKIFGAGSVTETAYGRRVDTSRGVIDLTTAASFSKRHAGAAAPAATGTQIWDALRIRSEEQPTELQSLMRI